MTIIVPEPAPSNRDAGNESAAPVRRATFKGILREIRKVSSNTYGVVEQLKFSIEPTSYSGKIRYEWYNLSRDGKAVSENSKFGILLSKLKQMDLYDSNGIKDELMLNNEFEWEQVEFPAAWQMKFPTTKSR